MLNRKLKLAIFCASVVLPINLSLAQVERLPGVVDKIVQDIAIPNSYSLDDELAEPLGQELTVKKVDNASQVIADLKAVVFEGNTAIDDEELQEIIAKYVNQPLTKGKLAELKYDVKKAYYDEGYILVHAVTKPQKFANGVLKVNVYEAEIGDIEIRGNDLVHGFLLKNIAKRTEAGDVVNAVAAESVIKDINDLYGVGATLVLRPGSKFKTTDFLITMREEDNDNNNNNNNNVGINNYGSDLTGEVVAYGHTEHSNLFKMGEQLKLDLQRSEEDLWTAAVGAVIPTGFRNVNFEASYLHSENDIVGRLSSLQASGETDIYDLGFSSKLINTRKHTLTTKIGFQDRVHESFLSGVTETKDNLDKLYTDVNYSYRGAASVFYGGVRISKGIDAFGSSIKGESGATRNTGDQEVWIIEPTFIALARPFSADGTIKALIRAQATSGTSLSSDLFSVGGYGSIRGFDVSQEAAEMGYVFNLEYSHVVPLDIPRTTIEAGPFVDGGAINNRVSGTLVDTHFYSAGLGLKLEGDYVPTGTTVIRLDWARPIGSYNSTKVSDDTFYFNINQEF